MDDLVQTGDVNHHQPMILKTDGLPKLALHDDAHSPAFRTATNSRNEIDETELDSDADAGPDQVGSSSIPLSSPGIIDPEPHVSNQFYTFNSASHRLMVRCILEDRYANADEITSATPSNVLGSWRSVWKDRNEDTAYLTGWKRIQEKLRAEVDEHGNEMLYFKSNPHQLVPHINQWHDIVQGCHADADFKHLGTKETIDRIKQGWTVGAKFYGIPESFIRVCVAVCPVCSSDASVRLPSSKRKRFEYTESFEVQAKEVPQRLQQLAAKHQVVLCIRQKYVRYKPFLAEVKDYCCHRAGEPNTKKPAFLKRKRYISKRCGCGFRIRAIVPITNYSEKEKTFVYQEEGKAIFKLYAVHSGHEPGPHEGSARIIHRLGPANLTLDSIPFFDSEEAEALSFVERDESEIRDEVIQHVHELRLELNSLETKLGTFSRDLLSNLSQDLAAVTQRLRNVEDVEKPDGLFITKEHRDDGMLNQQPFEGWREEHNKNKREDELVDQTEVGFSSDVEPGSEWQVESSGSRSKEDVLHGMEVKWSDPVKELCSPSDGKVILADADTRSCEQDGAVTVEGDGSLAVDNYYQEDVKWYEGISCGLDPTTVCGNGLSHSVQAGFRHSII